MRQSRSLEELRAARAGSVVSIGVFDGVHLGHRAILAANTSRAAELGAEPTVVTFGEHPKALLLGRAPRTLTTLEHRLEHFERAGMAHAVVLAFDADLRSMPAEAFVQRLVEGLGARAFVLGFDSKFGAERRGTPALLAERGLDVQVVPKVELRERAISSTAIREAVELGDLAGASAMLGRPVAVLGSVVRGDALGRQLGFPTANLDLHHALHPPVGVYAARARLQGETQALHPAVVNIGFRPTVDGSPASLPRVEVHLLDWSGELYDQPLEVEFLVHLRGEQRFDGLEALKAAIAADVLRARELLAAGAD